LVETKKRAKLTVWVVKVGR